MTVYDQKFCLGCPFARILPILNENKFLFRIKCKIR